MNNDFPDRLLGMEFGSLEEAKEAFRHLTGGDPTGDDLKMLERRVYPRKAPTLESFKNQLIEATDNEAKLTEELAVAREKRAKLTAIVKDQIDRLTQEVEQIDLAARFRAGDNTVERDPAAGNGGGGFREIKRDHQSSMSAAAGNVRDAAGNVRDAAMNAGGFGHR